jgi:phenylpropionate dioxygenase-like ring-hydroxylating dioxygenase large terminal subunit
MDEWHPIGALDEIPIGAGRQTLLMDTPITATRTDATTPLVRRAAGGATLATRVKFGYVWTTLGSPDHEVFDIPETDEADRRSLNGGSFIVATSAPRAVENFLDMGHFPYVHTGILGAEPRTEVLDYDVTTSADGILATRCLFYQPQAAAIASDGQMTEYVYRVPHPYCVMLYKSNPTDPTRMDVIALFNQPMTAESITAHNFLSLLDDVTTTAAIRSFQQTIFGQDKTILENQWPKRLPLDPGAEVPVQADKSSVSYRRWLSSTGLTYAVIPATP